MLPLRGATAHRQGAVAATLSDAELVTATMMQAIRGFPSDAMWLRHARPYLPKQVLAADLATSAAPSSVSRPSRASVPSAPRTHTFRQNDHTGQPCLRSLAAFDH